MSLGRVAPVPSRLILRLILSAVLAIVAVSLFLTYVLPNFRDYQHDEAAVSVTGPCRDEGSLRTCAGTWIVGSATAHGEVTGKDLTPGQEVTARVSGDRARVPLSGGVFAMAAAATVAVAVTSVTVLFRRRR